MRDAPGLAREILEIRPPCLEVQVSNSIEVFFTDCSQFSGNANLVLLHKDTLLRNIMIEPEEKSVRLDVDLQSPGIISVVVIPEETESTIHISSVAPLPVLPSSAAQELQQIFDNTLEAAKSIVVRQQSNPKGPEQQYLLVAGHKLSPGQEQTIRHMLWKERFRPFAVDLEFLLDNPLNEESASPRYRDDSSEESEMMVPTSPCHYERNMPDHAAVGMANAELDGVAPEALGPAEQGACSTPTNELQGDEMRLTKCYEEVLKGMLKFLSSCDAWSCFMYVMKECTSRGVLFTGMDQLGPPKVGLQCLYELPPLATEDQCESCESDMISTNVNKLLGGAGPGGRELDQMASCGGFPSELEASLPGHNSPSNKLPPRSTKAVMLAIETASEEDHSYFQACTAMGASGTGTPPLPVHRPGTPHGNVGGINAPQTENCHRGPFLRPPGIDCTFTSKPKAVGKPAARWDPSFRRMLRKSNSMPVRLDRKLDPHLFGLGAFTFSDCGGPRMQLPHEGGLAAFWPSAVLPAHPPASSLGMLHLLPGTEGWSFSMRVAAALICLWLCLVGGASDEGLNIGAFFLGLSSILMGVPVSWRFLIHHGDKLVMVARTGVLVVFLLRASGRLDCPCIPSWNREGWCMGGILQSTFWLAITAFGFKGPLWRHLALIALEAGAFVLAASRNDGRCQSSNWVAAWPALLGEVYSVASTAWQQHQLMFRRQQSPVASKVSA